MLVEDHIVCGFCCCSLIFVRGSDCISFCCCAFESEFEFLTRFWGHCVELINRPRLNCFICQMTQWVS